MLSLLKLLLIRYADPLSVAVQGLQSNSTVLSMDLYLCVSVCSCELASGRARPQLIRPHNVLPTLWRDARPN